MSYNFKSIVDVEVVAEPSKSAKVLIEENGVIKKAPTTAVGSKKELVYEWNFSADDEVTEIIENVDDDLTWLVERTDNIGWEMEFITYATYGVHDEDSDDWNTVIDSTLTTSSYINDTLYRIAYNSNGHMGCSFYNDGPEDFYNDWNTEYYSDDLYVDVYNKVHFDNDWKLSETDIGGCIHICQDYNNPFKSVKIYKITR